MKAFQELGVASPTLKSLEELGIKNPTEIQRKTIQLVIEGKDVVAGAATGSGKTLAFGAGILQNVKEDFGIQALILTPTRELAEQITRELKKFSKYKPLNISAIYGGVSIHHQYLELRKAEIVVGTPGRILDHLSRKTINLEQLKMLVLDEADRMLDMGFIEDVGKIISNCPKNRQTLLFFATISPDIVRITEKFLNKPIEVSAEQYVDPKKLKQVYYDIDNNFKYSLLKHLLEVEKSKLVMVFCNTRTNVDFVANNLKFNGIKVLPIHGGFSQEKRNKIMEKFHSESVQVLVATNVGARGLDIKGVSHVYNYDIPKDLREYIHRIGRTARAGKEGKVINIVTDRDYESFSKLIGIEDINIERLEIPYIKRVKLRWMPEKKKNRIINRFRNNKEFKNKVRSNKGNLRKDRFSKNIIKGKRKGVEKGFRRRD